MCHNVWKMISFFLVIILFTFGSSDILKTLVLRSMEYNGYGTGLVRFEIKQGASKLLTSVRHINII